MILKPITDGKVAGTGTLTLESRILGGILVSSDGTNAAVIIIRNDDASGTRFFDISTKAPGLIIGPIKADSDTIYYSITGTNASAQLYEWVN